MTMPPIGDTRDLKSLIKEYIDQNKVMIFSKTTCSDSQKVKQLFQSLDVTFKSLELDTIDNGAELQQSLLEMYGQKTVPNVFIGGQHVGGCDNTLKLHADDCLLPMIQGELDELNRVDMGGELTAAERDAQLKQKKKKEWKAKLKAEKKALKISNAEAAGKGPIGGTENPLEQPKKDSKDMDENGGFEMLGVLSLDQLDTGLKKQENKMEGTEGQQEEYRAELLQIQSDIKKTENKLAKKRNRQRIVMSALGLQQDSDGASDAKKIKLDPSPVERQVEVKKAGLKLLDTLNLIASHHDPEDLIKKLHVGIGKGLLFNIQDDSMLAMLKQTERCTIVEKVVDATDVQKAVQNGIDNAPSVTIFLGAEAFPSLVIKCLIHYVKLIRTNCTSALIICLGKGSTDSMKELEKEFVLLTK